LRFSLPCKHHLLHACATGVPIPKSLFHPRWWLNGQRAAGRPESSPYMSLALRIAIARLWCLQRPPRPAGKARLAGESQGGTTITLALRTPEQLHLGPDLIPRVSPPRESEPAWQLPASTAPPSLGQADARPILRRTKSIQIPKRRRTKGRRNRNGQRARVPAMESLLFIHHPNIEMLKSRPITRTWKSETIGL
jgi:hypothetical protein